MLPNPQFPADLVTFTEEILNGKLHGKLHILAVYDIQWNHCIGIGLENTNADIGEQNSI